MLWLVSYLRGALKIKCAYDLVLSLSSGFSQTGQALAVYGLGNESSSSSNYQINKCHRMPAQATLADTALSLMSFLRYRCF
jgi:hypothetical protein